MSIIQQILLLPSGQRIEIAQGDITTESVDAIVNAANAYLQHGGGVAAAISRRGGPTVQQESDAWVQVHGAVTHETPAYTRAGRLPCRYIIHAVGPVWGEGDEDHKLAAAIRGSLARAEELGVTSLAFPAISIGIFGFPLQRAAGLFLETLRRYYEQEPASPIRLLRLVLFDETTLQAFLTAAGSK